MKKLAKILLILSFVLAISVGILILRISQINAADAIPEPTVPCTEKDIEDPEFNSLRPYQASPCRDAPLAQMCGNTIKVLLEKVEENWNSSKCSETSCPYTGGASKIDVVIDLSGVELPILGNTEQVTNSHSPADTFDDAQKLNEYASWYLAGVTQNAQYGNYTPEQLVNFSGPSKKLNPQTIQELIRYKSLHNAGVKPDFTDPDTGITTKEADNHNQIVVCTDKNLDFSLFGINFSIPWIGEEQPRPCYEGVDNSSKGKAYRLVDWWDSKVWGWMDINKLIPNWNPYIDRWGYHVPPFSWQFIKDVYYQKAYSEWRGKECLLIPVTEKLICVDIHLPGTSIGLHTNRWADFYQYVPLSNTTDRKGKENYRSVPITAHDATFVGRPEDDTVITAVPRLFYPHTTEVSEAVKNLNNTFLPQDGVDTKTIPQNTEDNTSEPCKILDVRTNPGDDLTFENTTEKHQIRFTANYQVESVNCKFKGYGHPTYNPFGTPFPGKPIYECKSDIYATIDLTTQSPELDNIWENTVAGAGSTFRRIFPKVEEGAPVSCIADIPGVSNANYGLNSESSSSVKILNVLNPGGSTASTPQIYFPHLGSVYEYFLKGIQTALRPKGFGEPITNGGTCVSSTIVCGQMPDTLPKAQGSCQLGGTSPRVGAIPQSLIDIVTAAAETYKVPPNLILAIMFGEGAFNQPPYQKYDWTEENVINWATCEPLPGCSSPQTSIVSGLGLNWTEHSNQVIDELQQIDPSKKVADACNLIDEIYVIANMLHGAAGAGKDLEGHTCYGIEMKSSDPQSCAWEPYQFETAIRVYKYGSYWTPTSTSTTITCPYPNGCHCATRSEYNGVSGCGAGGFEKTACQVEDTCETVGGSTHTSHNACVYDVGHGR